MMQQTYIYENLSDSQFENLVVLICQELLGKGVQGFTFGRDGGRDARFHGRAECYPSSTKPWEGLIIVQAKHTNGHNKSFSDKEVYSKENKNSVIAKEIPRIRALYQNKEIDYYMLFSNRRLTANRHSELTKYISETTGIRLDAIAILGINEIERHIKSFPHIARAADIDPVDCPLIIGPQELAEIIEALEKNKEEMITQVSIFSPSPRISYSEKNELNNMSSAYADKLLKKNLKDTSPIQKFLSNPENKKYLEMYISMVDEFQHKIVAHRKSYQTFDRMMEYLIDLLCNRDETLRRNKSLTRLMLFYMYWNCDIGEKEKC